MADLNLAKFKKVASDRHATTLRHDDGHELRIAHASLTPKLKKELDRLPIHAAEGVQDVGGDDSAPADLGIPSPDPAVASQDVPAPGPDQGPPMSAAGPAAPDSFPRPAPADTAGGTPSPIQPFNAEQHKDAVKQEMLADAANTKNDMDMGHIKPETYSDLFANKSTLGKIGTIFGMMLSGAGSGLAHQPNLLMEMMDKQITNDLDAQKAGAANKQNWYRINLEKQMNQANIGRMQKENKLTDQQVQSMILDNKQKAYFQTMMGMLGARQHYLGQQADMIPPNDPRKPAAMQALNSINTAVQAKTEEAAEKAGRTSAFINSIWGGSSPSPELLNQENQFQNRVGQLKMLPQGEQVAKNMEEKHLPFVPGSASVPLNESDQKSWEHLTNLSKSFQDANRFLDKAGMFGSQIWQPGQKAEGEAMQKRIELEMGELVGLGRFTPEEAKRYKDMIPDLNGTHFTSEDQNKINVVQSAVNQKMQSLLETKGFTHPVAAQQEPLQYKNGIAYRRQGNYMVPVK